MTPLVGLALALLLQEPPQASGAPSTELRKDEPILGKPAEWSLDDSGLDGGRINVSAGTPLLAEPWPDAAVVAVAPGGELAVWETQPGWARVIWGEVIGWVLLDAGNRAPEAQPAPLPLALRAAILDKARELLGPGSHETNAGVFRLLSDGSNSELLGHIAAVASGIELTYRETYGLEPRPFDGALVLLSRTEDYETLRDLVHTGTSTADHGFEISGVAVLSRAELRRDEVVRTVVHELTHILNRRLLTPPLHPGLPAPLEPITPWLEEGLAMSLALSHVDHRGRLHPDTLSREEIRRGSNVSIAGAPAAIRSLEQAYGRGRVPRLADLLRENRHDFFQADADEIFVKYMQSALFIRFLLEDPKSAEAFRTALRSIASGSVESSVLLDQLTDEPQKLDNQLRAYVLTLAARSDI